jgi:hypothetical protein
LNPLSSPNDTLERYSQILSLSLLGDSIWGNTPFQLWWNLYNFIYRLHWGNIPSSFSMSLELICNKVQRLHLWLGLFTHYEEWFSGYGMECILPFDLEDVPVFPNKFPQSILKISWSTMMIRLVLSRMSYHLRDIHPYSKEIMKTFWWYHLYTHWE